MVNRIIWNIPASYTAEVGSINLNKKGLKYHRKIAMGIVRNSFHFNKNLKNIIFFYIYIKKDFIYLIYKYIFHNNNNLFLPPYLV